ncbi:MAG: tetratricopeptide repeat protein [Verrucomicrobia subdivision 3 bacterium]|nr:tetratricopeptide repeat protein [Limisphaerales bacterium]
MESTETHPDRLIDFWEWLVENRMQVILAIIIAIGAVLIVYTQRVNAKLAEEESGEDVLAAMDLRFSTDEVNPFVTASERFGNVAVNHPGTAGASNAKFLQASALFDEGKFKEADAAFAGYVSENPRSPLLPAAALGQAACKASLVDSGAVAAYENVRNQYPGTSEAVQATLALGRMALEAKDAPKARELLTSVSTNRVSLFWGTIADDLLKQLPPVEDK